MNIVLWILQVALAFLYVAGGGFKTFNPDDVARQIRAIPRGAWRAIGVFEVLGAAALAVETLALAAVYARYSLKLVATNPLVFALPMGLMATLVAVGRYMH